MGLTGGRMLPLACSLLDAGKGSTSLLGARMMLTRDRFEDEKVIQALEMVQKETGLPFVSYT